MHFSLSHFGWSCAVVSGAFVVAACRTPGEGFEEASNANGTPTVGTSGTPTNTANASTGADAGNTNAAVTSDGTAMGTSAGDPSGGAAETNDAAATTETVSSSDGSGGATSSATNDTSSSDDTTSTTGATSGSNLIDNGDFQTDSAACEVDDSDWLTEGTLNWAGVDEAVCAYCIVLDPDQSGQLNWSGNSGTPPTLEGGQRYSFSFDVYSNEGTAPSLTAKLGQPVDPYAAFVEEEVSVPSSSSTQSFTFSMSNSDQAGIAFFVSAGAEWGKICFDNISIEAM